MADGRFDMNHWGIDIDAVVREVLAQLSGGESSAVAEIPAPTPGALPQSNGEGSPKEEPAVEPAPVAPRARELAVSDSVVTLAAIESRLSGVRTLVVPARAVVTPSVRDELRRRRIVLRRAETQQPASFDGERLVLMATGSRFNIDPLVKMLEGDGVGLELHRATCLVKATDTLAERITEDEVATVLTTRHAAAAICLANRHAGVRAIGASDPSHVLADAEAIGANLLVVDPVRLPLQALKQMIGRFATLGSRTCPESLRERLA